MHFVKSTCRIALALNFMGRVSVMRTGQDKMGAWSVMVPSILSHSLNALVASPRSHDVVERFQEVRIICY